VFERSFKEESAALGHGVEAVVLRLEFESAETVLFMAAAHLIAKVAFGEVGVEAGYAAKAVGVIDDGSADEVVFGAVVGDDGKGNGNSAVDAVGIHDPKELIGGADATAMTCSTEVGVGVEDAEAVAHNELRSLLIVSRRWSRRG
jgi:hypothetical protein